MSRTDLRQLLENVQDTRELVLNAPVGPGGLSAHAELLHVWRAARAEAGVAYRTWTDGGGAAAYSVYRAAQDRADAAQDALAGNSL